VYSLLAVLQLIAILGSVAWLVGLLGQFMDLFNGITDLRLAKDTPLRERADRRRLIENAWSVIGGTLLALVLAFGVDVAARAFFEWREPFVGVIVLIALLVLAAIGAVLIVAGVTWREGLSYAILRANLAEDAGLRIKTDQVAEFRAQLAQIDARKRHIRFGLRDRAGLRPVRAKLDQVADEFAVVPPTGFGAMRSIKWKTANAYVWRGNPVRLIPSLLALIVLVDVVVAIISGGRVAWPWYVLSTLAIAVSFLLALLEARVVLAGKAAWHAVYQKQRLEAIKLLEDLEKTSRKGVTGLGDRVARALQILRDQQS
jgi:hypothetical protein